MDSDTEMVDTDAMPDADSLVSTVSSEEQSEYDVEEILYERDLEDGPGRVFLVKWADYELHRAQFIPRENFNARIILRNWERKKRDIAAGLVAPFDIEAWQADQDRIAEETMARKEARRAKRAERAASRLALLDHPGNDTTEDLNEDSHRQDEPNPDSEANHPVDQAQTTHEAKQGKCSSVSSDASSSLFVPGETSSGARPKMGRLLSQKDSSLLGPYNTESPAKASEIHPGPQKHQHQLQQESEEQVGQQSARPRRSLNRRTQPFQQGQPKQPPRSSAQTHNSAVLASTASLSKPPLLGFGVGPPQTARPNRPRRREREPDVSQLKLLRPSEYPAREGGADSSVFSTIRSPEEARPSSESGDNIYSIPPIVTSESTTASTKLASPNCQGEPNASQVKNPVQSPKEQDGSSEPRASEMNEREVQKASTANLSSPDPGNRQETGKPQEARRPPFERASRSQSICNRAPQRASRADGDPNSAGPSDPREKLPDRFTRRQSPSGEPRAVETSSHDRSSDSSVDRELPAGQSGGDSYRASFPRASKSRRGADCYRPSPSPPFPDLSHSRLPPHRNSYRPMAPSDDMPPRAEKTRAGKVSHLVRPRSPCPSTRPPPKLDDAEAQIARMPIGVPMPGQSQKTTEGYWWNWGEVLGHVYFGPDKKRVGPVRLCGMDDAVRGDLLGSKGPGRTFEVWFKDLYTVAEYSSLCDQAIDNTPRGNAWMEGFKDTNPALFYMAEELRGQHLIAVYRPAKARANVWIAYSRKSHCFDFLNWNTNRTPAGVPIYLAVRPSLPLMSREREEPVRSRRDFPANVHFREGESETRRASEVRPGERVRPLAIPAVDRARMAPQLPTPRQTLSGSPAHQRPEAISPATRNPSVLATQRSNDGGQSATVTPDPRLRRRPSLSAVAQPEDHIHPSRRSLMEGQGDARGADRSKPKTQRTGNVKRPEEVTGPSNLDSMDLTPDSQAHTSAPHPLHGDSTLMLALGVPDKMIMDFFEKKVKITVKELACLQQGNEDATTDNFYLHFPRDQEETEAEYKLMHAWLKAHDVMVWTDWAKFLKNCKHGVVIFHESFLAYWTMRPAIREVLWASNPFNFWNVRLARPLESPDERFCERGSYFQCLFPTGHAYLITEDCFTDLKRTAMIICWFYVYQKNRPGSYKLFLRPDVLEYLNGRLEDPRRNEADDHGLLSVLYWIVKANSVSPRFPHFVPESLNPGQLDNQNNNVLCLPVPKYGSRAKADNPEIPEGLTQVERDADHLVEAFAGFTILNASRFRKTIVITSIKNTPLFQRWHNWGHVAVYSMGTFFDRFRLDERDLQERISNSGNRGRSGQEKGVHSASQTPRTPVDPRTPKAPWDDSSRESSNPAPAQRRAPGRNQYPAPFQ